VNIYLISQDVNEGYDTYDSAVVYADSDDEARMIYPGSTKPNWNGVESGWKSWCDSDQVKVSLLGASEDAESGLILASFNAGP